MKLVRAFACLAMSGACLHAGGYGAGVQKAFDLGGGNAVVPRLDYLHVTDSSNLAGTVDAKATGNILALGADCDHFVGKEPGRGFYVLAGGGLAGMSIHLAGSTAAASASTTVRKRTLYPEAGLGFLFTRNVGLEVLYKGVRYHDVNLAVGGVPVRYAFSGAVQGSLVVRF
jgi:hypothetical protein